MGNPKILPCRINCFSTLSKKPPSQVNNARKQPWRSNSWNSNKWMILKADQWIPFIIFKATAIRRTAAGIIRRSQEVFSPLKIGQFACRCCVGPTPINLNLLSCTFTIPIPFGNGLMTGNPISAPSIKDWMRPLKKAGPLQVWKMIGRWFILENFFYLKANLELW